MAAQLQCGGGAARGARACASVRRHQQPSAPPSAHPKSCPASCLATRPAQLAGAHHGPHVMSPPAGLAAEAPTSLSHRPSGAHVLPHSRMVWPSAWVGAAVHGGAGARETSGAGACSRRWRRRGAGQARGRSGRRSLSSSAPSVNWNAWSGAGWVSW